MSHKTRTPMNRFPIPIGLLLVAITAVAAGPAPQLCADQPRELSAPPQEYPIYPDDRPMWVDQPDRVDENWAELVVQSVPSLSSEKSLESLAEQQRIALTAYVDQYLGVEGGGGKLDLTREQIESTLVDRERTYDGTLTTSTGEMYQHATVLVLDERFHEQIMQQWKASTVAERLKGMGVLAALALVGLTGLTILLKSVSPRPRQEFLGTGR